MHTPFSPGDVMGAGAALSMDTPCRKCGYNLRGLAPEGFCPECGTPIGLSLHGRLLRYADPAWVERLARGVDLILWGLLLTILMSLLGGVAKSLSNIPLLPELAASLGALLGAYGTWLLTERDPSGLGEDEYGRIRRWTRTFVVIGVVGTGVNVLVSQLPTIGLSLITTLLILLAGLATLIGWAGEFCKLWFMEKLAHRLPDPKLARRARFLRWAFTTTGAVLVISSLGIALFAWFAAGTPGTAGPGTLPAATGGTTVSVNVGGSVTTTTAPPGSPLGGMMIAFGCTTLIVVLVMLVLLLMVVRMQWQLRNRLREQALIARETWARATQPPVPPPPTL